MASAAPQSVSVTWRPAEWLLVAALLVVLLLSFMRYASQVNSQAELAAIKTTIGALRTVLVLDHLQRQLPSVTDAGLPAQAVRNPFDLIGQKPLGYAGELSRLQAATAPSGSWFYVDDCACVGYRPVDEAALDSASGEAAIWYRVVRSGGVWQLTPKERYLWADESIE